MQSGGGAEACPLSAAQDIDDFVREPRDRYIARRSFCFWQLGTDVKGVIVWGQPTEEDAREMVRSFEAGARLDQPHVSLVDMRSLGAVDVAAFEVIMRYMAERQPVFERTVRRQVMLHGSGAIGAAVAGFYRVVQPSYPVESHTDLAAALSWLVPGREAVVADLVEALRTRFIHTSGVALLLRAELERRDALPRLREAARGLGMSPRTLQRALAGANTSYRAEAARFRLEKAERLLAGSALSVKAVARSVGTTPERLSALFRRAHGVTPEVWRARFVRVALADT